MELPPISSIFEINVRYPNLPINEKMEMARGLFGGREPNVYDNANLVDACRTEISMKKEFKTDDIVEAYRILNGIVQYPIQELSDIQYAKVDPFYFNGTDENLDVFYSNPEQNRIGMPMGRSLLEDPKLTFVRSLLTMKEAVTQNLETYDDYLKQLFALNTEKGSSYYLNQLAMLDEELAKLSRTSRDLLPENTINFSKMMPTGNIEKMKIKVRPYEKEGERKTVQLKTRFSNLVSSYRSSKMDRYDPGQQTNYFQLDGNTDLYNDNEDQIREHETQQPHTKRNDKSRDKISSLYNTSVPYSREDEEYESIQSTSNKKVKFNENQQSKLKYNDPFNSESFYLNENYDVSKRLSDLTPHSAFNSNLKANTNNTRSSRIIRGIQLTYDDDDDDIISYSSRNSGKTATTQEAIEFGNLLEEKSVTTESSRVFKSPKKTTTISTTPIKKNTPSFQTLIPDFEINNESINTEQSNYKSIASKSVKTVPYNQQKLSSMKQIPLNNSVPVYALNVNQITPYDLRGDERSPVKDIRDKNKRVKDYLKKKKDIKKKDTMLSRKEANRPYGASRLFK